MSAESPKRAPRLPTIVPPEPVEDRSIIESVTGFINEVTLTSASPPIDQKEQIQWVRFETTADISNPSFGEDYDLESGIPPPLILILGYKTGIQIWAIPANGEATEVLSWRHGVVRCLKVLPTPISSYVVDNASEPTDDLYALKRPLMAICESSQVSSTGPQFCTMNIISLRDGDSIKSIKFKTTILEIAANHQSIVVTFAERIAVFDARTLEDRLTITTCYPSPGLSPNPIALGTRWLAYAERKLIPSKRSAGGCDCDGVSSYTATMLNAAKTLGKGLRELGEQVAAGLTGTGTGNVNTVGVVNTTPTGIEQQLHPGIVTILDIKDSIKDTSPTGTPMTVSGNDPIIAHFVAHTDIVAGMTFDASGLLLLTADKRGHDFHVFRINPHPCGSASASVHHLYILHRGDTTAKVQDMIFSLDSRWAAITTARGTTHVFPVSPYGGPATFRTHGSAEVVNRLSRFHRSAGLSADGRSSSPICPVFHSENGSVSADPYHNPRLPPFPRPYVVMPLKQLRQPLTLLPANPSTTPTATSSSSRQRQSSVSEDSGSVFRVCATFARPRDWLLQPLTTARDLPALKNPRNACDSLFVMAGHGSMIQYDLEPKYSSGVPASKQNDDSPIELYVEAKAQWNLLRKDTSIEIQPPLSSDNWLLKNRLEIKDNPMESDASDNDERWLSQVEIITSSGPHRRLWMGPQFIFKTYNTPSGSTLQHIDSEAVEIGVNCPANRPARSNPMQTPSIALGRGVVPVLIESGSASSIEQSPRFMNQYHQYMSTEDLAVMPAETQLREDLADAMRESPRDSGLPTNQTSSASCASTSARSSVSIAKVVNPLGTVTTITESPRESILAADEFAEEYSSGAYIHENCDESMFRPYVAVISGSIDDENHTPQEKPEHIGQKLIVPVIDSSRLEQQNREKSRLLEIKRQQDENVAKFEQMSLLNRKDAGVEKIESKEEKTGGKKSNAMSGGKDDEKVLSKDTKGDKTTEKSADKKNDSDKKSSNDSVVTETVTVKLKKKANKAQVKPSPEPQIESDEIGKKSERSVKNDREPCSSQDDQLEFTVVIPDTKIKSEKVEEFVIPKAVKSKKKSLAESSSSKESSVEKELSPTTSEGTKSKKKKQKKNDPQTVATSSSSDDAKGNSASEVTSKAVKTNVENPPDSSFLMESIDKIDGAQCAEIQTSLLKSTVSATVSIRKGSLQEKAETLESSEIKPTKSGRKKKWSRESIEIEPIATNSPNADETAEFTYPEPSESVLDLDNLSFKSSIDDQISLIPLESLQNEPEWSKQRTNDYDKLSDDAETGSGAHYSDCKSFQLIIDEPESYMRTSDTNSSDETEDSSQSKSTKSSEKTVDEDDEELQPLICSTTSDVAVDLSKNDALPNESSQSDSTTQPQTSEQSQQQPQKQSNSNNNNKKKFRKKRR